MQLPTIKSWMILTLLSEARRVPASAQDWERRHGQDVKFKLSLYLAKPDFYDRKGLVLYSWCIMSNHVHLVAEAKDLQQKRPESQTQDSDVKSCVNDSVQNIKEQPNRITERTSE